MSNAKTNGMNKSASNKGRRGPRPIVTVAELRARLLKEAMAKEVRKIERKIGKAVKRENALKDRLTATQLELDRLRTLKTEYYAEVNA